MKVLVTGASGWIGCEVATQLSRMGITVVAMDLGAPKSGPWIDYLQVDIGDDRVLKSGSYPTLNRIDAVVHCAGYAHRPHETPEEIARFWAINRDGTRRMLELARQIGISRFVYLSSIAFYDWSLGSDFAEEGPLAAPSAYAASKLAGERLCRESGLDWRVTRLGTVFGDGDRANFAKLATSLAHHAFVLPGGGGARKSVLPVTLAAELLADLAVRLDVPHRALNVALPEAPTLAEICRGFSTTCGFPRPWSVPLPVLRIMARFGDHMAKHRAGFPLTTVNLRKLTTSTTVDTRRMQDCWPSRSWANFDAWLSYSKQYYRRVAS